jgi:RimJ/RimL family protein N-acetyltransferase
MDTMIEWTPVESSDQLFFTIVCDEVPQGVASYLRIEPEHGTVEIGDIWFGTPLQRTTAATEAIFLLARHAFDDLGYRRLEWTGSCPRTSTSGASSGGRSGREGTRWTS